MECKDVIRDQVKIELKLKRNVSIFNFIYSVNRILSIIITIKMIMLYHNPINKQIKTFLSFFNRIKLTASLNDVFLFVFFMVALNCTDFLIKFFLFLFQKHFLGTFS